MNRFLVALVVGLLALAVCALIAYTAQARHDDLIARALTETGIQPEPAPARVTHPCARIGCNDEATVYIGASHETWQFCMTHGLPYLVRQDIDITDQQMREVMDDARRITREAAGGATA